MGLFSVGDPSDEWFADEEARLMFYQALTVLWGGTTLWYKRQWSERSLQAQDQRPC